MKFLLRKGMPYQTFSRRGMPYQYFSRKGMPSRAEASDGQVYVGNVALLPFKCRLLFTIGASQIVSACIYFRTSHIYHISSQWDGRRRLCQSVPMPNHWLFSWQDISTPLEYIYTPLQLRYRCSSIRINNLLRNTD